MFIYLYILFFPLILLFKLISANQHALLLILFLKKHVAVIARGLCNLRPKKFDS